MTNVYELSLEEEGKMSRILDYVSKFAEKHKVLIGTAEMAAGAALLSYGVQSGAIEMGKDFVATAFGHNDFAKWIGLGGGAAGAVAGLIIGGVGIAAGGGAIGIPAAAVCAGAAWIFGASGFTVTSAIQSFLEEFAANFGDVLVGTGILALGIALLLDGARRVLPENVTEKIKEAVSCFKKGIIFLVKFVGTVLANTYKKLQDISSAAYKLINEMGPKNAGIIAGSAITTTALTVGGAAAGSAFATSTVTVLGSQALGGVALALGVVSAPVWPIVVLGVAGGSAGVVIGKLAWDYFNKSEKPEALLAKQYLLGNERKDSEC